VVGYRQDDVEVMAMRKTIAVLFVAVGVLIGFSFRTTAVNAQPQPGLWLPFSPGESVKLYVDLPEGVIGCKVSQVQNGFVGCARDEPRQAERWINLRFVKEIKPPER
jgi:hypothetical protein